MQTLLTRFGFAIVLSAAFVGALALTSDADESAAPAYKPIASIKNIMNAANHEEHGLFGMIKTFAASSPARGGKDWAIMGHRAYLLAEAGNVLAHLAPPKGDVASWREKAQAFASAAKALKKACAMQKAEKLTTQLEAVRKACDACHDAHRPE